MSVKIEALLELAQEYYERSRLATKPLVKAEYQVMGDDYLKQADDLQAGATVVQSAFPKTPLQRSAKSRA